MKKNLLVLLFLFFAFQIKAQNDPNDCVNAIIVCGNGTFASNASGVGNTQEISACGGFAQLVKRTVAATIDNT